MAEIVQRMSEMEGGQWGEGEQRGGSLQNTKHKYKNAKKYKKYKNTRQFVGKKRKLCARRN